MLKIFARWSSHSCTSPDIRSYISSSKFSLHPISVKITKRCCCCTSLSDAQTAPADDDEDDFGSKRQFCAPGATNNGGNQEELWPMGVLKFIYAMKYNASPGTRGRGKWPFWRNPGRFSEESATGGWFRGLKKRKLAWLEQQPRPSLLSEWLVVVLS